MTELKPIPNFEGYYYADIYGNIYDRRKNIMKQREDKNGYKIIDFTISYKRYRGKLVHRLIAQTFIPNPNNLPEINHKDEDKANNCVSNLEWCDKKYNINYGTCIKRISKNLKNKSTKGRKKRTVLQFDLDNNLIAEYSSTRECEKFGFNHSSVGAVCNNKKYYKTYKGYIWKYKGE